MRFDFSGNNVIGREKKMNKKILIFKQKRFLLMFAICLVLVFVTYAGINYGDLFSHAESEEVLTFSKDSGCYDERFELSISAPEGSTIYYTTDGSVPVKGKEGTKQYTGSITVDNLLGTSLLLSNAENAAKYCEDGSYSPDASKLDRATVIRAIAVNDIGVSSPVSTRTYFINNDIASKYNGCPVMSIVTDPDNLLNDDSGIYVLGSKYKTSQDILDANFMNKGKEWERAAHMEFFDEQGNKALSQGIGIRIHGGYTRREAQKSLNIYFRDEYDYGKKSLKGYELIPGSVKTYYQNTGSADDAVKDKYSKVMVRNGGNDAGEGKYRDVFIQKMVEGRAFTTQSSRPCMVYLNGEYWGIYNLTEKYSDDYLEEEFDVNKNNVIMYKNFEIDEGETLDPEGAELAELEALGDLDMTIEANYKKFQDIVDIDSYVDYYATEIYINNNDWWSGESADTPRNNIQFWKVADPSSEDPNNPYADGKWRYMLFDTEWSTNIYGGWKQEANWDYDSILNHAMGADNGYNGDPIFIALMENSDFRKRMTNTILDLRNWNYEYSHCMPVLEQLRDEYKGYNEKHKVRWNSGNADAGYNGIKTFIQNRPGYVLGMLEDNMDEITESDRVNVFLSAKASGDVNLNNAIKINTIMPDIANGWSGTYYKDYPITVRANAPEGYVFAGWELNGCEAVNSLAYETEVTLTSGNASIKASYVKIGEDMEIVTGADKGYIVEYVVPFATKKQSGDKVGFEVQINDCTEGSRYGTLNLFATNSPYNSGEEFGTIILDANESSANVSNDSIKAVATDKKIIADGIIEDAWSKAPSVSLNNYQTAAGTKHCNASAKFLWDADNLYVMVITEDEDMCVNDNTYESDSVEIFFDEDALNPVEYDSDMFQYRTLFNGTNEWGKLPENPIAYNVVTAAKRTGYQVEYKIPFKNAKTNNDKVSFEVQVINSISSYTEGRVGKLTMFGAASAFNNRNQFGMINLCDSYPSGSAGIDEGNAYALKVSKEITIDGICDSEWNNAKEIDISYYTAKTIDEEPYPQDIWAKAKLMWDANNLYVLVVVEDQDKCRNSGTESDAVEVFFDEDVSETALNSTAYTETAFQYRVFQDGTVDEVDSMKNYSVAGYSVNSGATAAGKFVSYVEVPQPSPTPAPTAAPTARPDSEGFKVTFTTDSHATVTTYKTQDYTDESGKAVNQSYAIARDSQTGEVDVSGDGQVNYTIVMDEGYEIADIVIGPSGMYKNHKGSADTGLDNTYRITKITGDMSVAITTKPKSGDSGNDEPKSEFTVTFTKDDHVKVTTYMTQDYTNELGKKTNQSSAVARDSVTGDVDISGSGQVNFTLVPDAGYEIVDVSATPAMYFKNLKGPEDTALDNTYRLTKVTGDVSVVITSQKVGGGNNPSPTKTPEGLVTTPTKKPDVTAVPTPTKKPEPTKTPEGTNPEPTKTPEGTNPEPTKAPDGTNPEPTKAPDGTNPEPTKAPEGTNSEPTKAPDGINPDTTANPSGNGQNNSGTQLPTDNTGITNNAGSTDNDVNPVKLGKPRITVKKKGGKKAKISWKKVAGANRYELQYSLKSNFKKGLKKIILKKTSVTIKNLKKGKVYYFRVRGIAKNGGKNIYGKYSSKKKIKI